MLYSHRLRSDLQQLCERPALMPLSPKRASVLLEPVTGDSPMRLNRARRTYLPTWTGVMARGARFARALGLYSIRRQPIRHSTPLTVNPLESRDAPSDTLGALLGSLGAFGTDAWLRGFTREPAELRSVLSAPSDHAAFKPATSDNSPLAWVSLKPSGQESKHSSQPAQANEEPKRNRLDDVE